ncbi:right-handed parallel beta-helix repeat-containing protein [Ochrovirga pacifica]|uniref:right-handed parallel beta-helix repeat-containing protein n=1 Tax=Ochrovirga pacifica TaxID=1042376 RepID=UPI0002559500|nr:right-handed parallel beta-helix repeat-containing protein [Ochrovirga pacifica]
MKKRTFFKLALVVLTLSAISCSKNIVDEDQELKNDKNLSLDLGDSKKTAITQTIRVSNQVGSTNYLKLKNALAQANASTEILLDVDVNFTSADKAIVLDGSNVNLRGEARGNGKYKLTRTGTYNNRNHIFNSMIVVNSDHISIDNIQFYINNGIAYRCMFLGDINNNGQIADRLELFTDISIKDCAFKQAVTTETTRGVFFEGSFKDVVIENCFFNNWFGLVARDCPTLDGFIVNNNRFYNGSHQISFDGALLGETDPTYGLGVNLVKHANIRVTNNDFYLTKSFNLAIANTRNVYVFGNMFKGGTASYSQPIHIEDESKNIRIVNNSIESPNNYGILIFATGKVGHGQGRTFTEEEKKLKGSGNVLIKNNTMVTSDDQAVIATYLKGYLKFEGNNVFNANNGISVQAKKSNTGAEVIFVDNAGSYNGANLSNALANGKIVIDDTNTIVTP